MEAGDDLAPETDRVVLVHGEVVGHPGVSGVHVSPAELLFVCILTSGHLHKWRSPEKHLGLVFHHHHVVARAR